MPIQAAKDIRVGRVRETARGRCSRGSAPSAALGRLEDGAPATHVRCAVKVQFHKG